MRDREHYREIFEMARKHILDSEIDRKRPLVSKIIDIKHLSDSEIVDIKHLLDSEKIDEYILRKHLNAWDKPKPTSMSELLFGMLYHASNRWQMRNAIGNREKLDELRTHLEDFNPQSIINKYGNDWKKLFGTIKDNYTPPRPMEINNPNNSWVKFCKTIISASHFLSRFSTVGEFDEFVEQFYLNEYTRVALPLLLDSEVFGLGFALACDFLKENGYPKFVKPDVHIKAIFKGLDISRQKASDYEVFKDVIRFSEEIGEIPYAVDKLFWLVGSSNFYLNNDIKIRTDRDLFIKEVKNTLAQKTA